ncbi:hypothetical protein KL912_000681 [Ogataea haglerorum]|nr:hypothetical protein KL912_000681 [Ogataea haglerorum]
MRIVAGINLPPYCTRSGRAKPRWRHRQTEFITAASSSTLGNELLVAQLDVQKQELVRQCVLSLLQEFSESDVPVSNAVPLLQRTTEDGRSVRTALRKRDLLRSRDAVSGFVRKRKVERAVLGAGTENAVCGTRDVRSEPPSS